MEFGYRLKYRNPQTKDLEWLDNRYTYRPVAGGECGVFPSLQAARSYATRGLDKAIPYQVWRIYIGDDPVIAEAPYLAGTYRAKAKDF